MNIETYQAIVSARGEDATFKRKKDKYTRAEHYLRKDLVKNRTVWTGKCWYDYRAYLCNRHSCFGVCCAIKIHPINRRQRFWLMITELGFLVPLLIIERYLLKNEFLGIIVSGTVLFIIMKFLEMCIVCKCTQGINHNPTIRKIATFFGGCFTFIFAIFSVLLGIIFIFLLISLAGVGGSGIGSVYFGALLLDWFFYNIIWATCCFMRRRYIDTSEKEKSGKTSRYYVSYYDYLAWKNGDEVEIRENMPQIEDLASVRDLITMHSMTSVGSVGNLVNNTLNSTLNTGDTASNNNIVAQTSQDSFGISDVSPPVYDSNDTDGISNPQLSTVDVGMSSHASDVDVSAENNVNNGNKQQY